MDYKNKMNTWWNFKSYGSCIWLGRPWPFVKSTLLNRNTPKTHSPMSNLSPLDIRARRGGHDPHPRKLTRSNIYFSEKRFCTLELKSYRHYRIHEVEFHQKGWDRSKTVLLARSSTEEGRTTKNLVFTFNHCYSATLCDFSILTFL